MQLLLKFSQNKQAVLVNCNMTFIRILERSGNFHRQPQPAGDLYI